MTNLAFAGRILELWDFRDPAGSKIRFLEAAEEESDAAHRQSLITQVARAHGLQGNYEAGHGTLDSLGDPAALLDEPGVRALVERGRLYNSSGDTQLAVPLFRAAYDRAQRAGLIGLAADAAHMLAITLPKEEHEDWARRGIAIAKGSDDPLATRMTAALLNNLGWAYADDERWPEALELFEQAIEARRRSSDAYGVHVARWTRARALRALGRYQDALVELRELASTEEGAADSHVAAEIAENERALGG
jgi:tetratricopeptide (TPR) repeat protein